MLEAILISHLRNEVLIYFLISLRFYYTHYKLYDAIRFKVTIKEHRNISIPCVGTCSHFCCYDLCCVFQVSWCCDVVSSYLCISASFVFVTGCGGVRVVFPNAMMGTIAAPQFNDGVPIQLSCRWAVINPYRRGIRFRLDNSSGDHCRALWISNSTRRILEPLCTQARRFGNWIASVSRATVTLNMPLNETRLHPFLLRYSGEFWFGA